ncbi:hypothetical protein Q7P37_006842 [Cladosporium fusiforme]
MYNLVCNLQIMSDYFYDPNQVWNSSYWAYTEPLPETTAAGQSFQPAFCAPPSENLFLQQQLPYNLPHTNNVVHHGYPPNGIQQPRWHQASLAGFDQYQIPSNQQCVQYPSHQAPVYPTPGPSIAAPSPNYLSPDPAPQQRLSRNDSRISNRSSTFDQASSEVSRSTSPNARAIADYGYKNHDGTWSCAWPGCTSRSRFTRACDLRKHYKRHSKTLFCRQSGCPQSTEGGFSSKKDRARHEAKHNPMITCEWQGCGRLFSRVDNMVRKRWMSL